MFSLELAYLIFIIVLLNSVTLYLQLCWCAL